MDRFSRAFEKRNTKNYLQCANENNETIADIDNCYNKYYSLIRQLLY